MDLGGSAMPSFWLRMITDSAPNAVQRSSSSGVTALKPSAKNPPMSEPHKPTPDRPIESAW